PVLPAPCAAQSTVQERVFSHPSGNMADMGGLCGKPSVLRFHISSSFQGCHGSHHGRSDSCSSQKSKVSLGYGGKM
ncbi:unnamed protein product, partial [Coccothraustes coccothraustes]